MGLRKHRNYPAELQGFEEHSLNATEICNY
jgi:hypothetical protein